MPAMVADPGSQGQARTAAGGHAAQRVSAGRRLKKKCPALGAGQNQSIADGKLTSGVLGRRFVGGRIIRRRGVIGRRRLLGVVSG